MNKFILKRPLKKIIRDKKIYVGILLQLIIAFGILNIFLSLLINIYENKKKLEETNVKYQIEIQSREFEYSKFNLITWGDMPFQLNEYGEFPFKKTAIEQINRQCPNCELSVSVTLDIIYLGDLLKQDERVQICYTSDIEKVYCSKRIKEILEDVNDNNTINAKDFPHTITGNILTTVESRKYEIEYSDEDSLILYMPIEIYYNLYHPKNLQGTVIRLKASSQETVLSEELNKIVSQLNEMYSDKYKFDIKSEVAKYLVRVEEAEKEAKFFVFIAGIIFAIVLIGMIGIFIMLVSRRKKEIAICCALGQTKQQIIFEIFLEVSLLNLLSYFVGLVSAWLIMQNGISVATIVCTYNWWAGIISFFVSVFLTGMAIAPVQHIVNEMSPIDILSSL